MTLHAYAIETIMAVEAARQDTYKSGGGGHDRA